MLVSFMLVIALIVALVAFSAAQITSVGDSYRTVIQYPLLLESTLQKFHGEYRELRRIITMIAHFTGEQSSQSESLFNEAYASFNLTNTHLDKADAIIGANPTLTQAEKNVRMTNSGALRNLLKRYHDEVILPVMNASRAHDRKAALEVSTHTGSIVSEVMEKTDAMLSLAAEAANNQVEQAESDARSTITLSLAIALVAVLIAIAIALLVSNYISKALVPLTEFMHRAATEGDIGFPPELLAIITKVGGNQDELGRITAAATEFFKRVAEIAMVLKNIAGGDLTSDIPLLSARDFIGRSVQKMQGNLHRICDEINAASLHVAECASQVTTGAQTLSSGAAQQNASVEALSDSLTAITERTKYAAHIAEQAARLSGTIKDNAEKSRCRMEEMLTASGQIREANESIRKLTRIIDEIAFQSNLLSVNAAIEAARAGRHGKGFSVVAESVRQLALKSAQATRDIERLTVNSMEKAELGVGVAGEAFASLAAIISGIDENNSLASKVAESSKEQSQDISIINASIAHVSYAVRQNLVTAEESAAASEEMCAQSAMLRDLIAQFKLKNNDTRHEVFQEYPVDVLR